ncbi:DUF418 domain-containing protein [Aquibacillus salsiterrae]|uniref:DUF418 domain-containing protein n=1 Tax=Aquibacillus salsiterrae TaxID=2950439 RepID=A0A9X3WCW1_9BACI|nr:DUF418 domain-containing protein [Aquibacillus salsiterrae]MDC3417237.1 DUF418 domain-containing protein [Aquibacillus salsiterrae]
MQKINGPLSDTNDRLAWIDAARGFAILGIFMVNVPAFNAPFFLYGGEKEYFSSSIDYMTQSFIDIFFQASFYTLFSFLFGFGIQMLIDRLSTRTAKINTFIFRRLFVLLCFGLIHAFLLWHGDILLSYGLIGMFLFLFFKRTNRTLTLWAFSLLLIPAGLYTYLLYQFRDQLDVVDNQAISQAFANYGQGTYIEVLQQNYQDWANTNTVFGYFFLICTLLPLFLLGMVFARKRWLHDVEVNKTVLKRLWIITLVLFIVGKAGPYLVGNPTWLSFPQDIIGGTASAIFYIISLTLLYQKRNLQRYLVPFTYVGRMSLSNYILQSVISFWLFYSVGLGLYGKVSPFGSVIIVLVIYCFQILASKWWMKRYKFGPLEWLWRVLMYGQNFAIKRMVKRG